MAELPDVCATVGREAQVNVELLVNGAVVKTYRARHPSDYKAMFTVSGTIKYRIKKGDKITLRFRPIEDYAYCLEGDSCVLAVQQERVF